jgi:hypothetical protein
MKNILLSLSLLSFLVISSPAQAAKAAGASPDWKGPSDNAEVHLGALAGLAILNFNTGFALLGTASKKIIKNGFVPEIANSVSLETELGPVFAGAGSTLFSYSLHLRWDFEMNEKWIFFALGGAAGYVAPTTFAAGNTFALFPRIGLGAFFRASDLIMIRGEVSHELIAAGVTIPLYL